MDYGKLVETISVEKRGTLTDKLVDIVLASKNDDKMPSQLANTILGHWQKGVLSTNSGLAALLEAALLLEPEKTVSTLTELQLTNITEQLKEVIVKA